MTTMVSVVLFGREVLAPIAAVVSIVLVSLVVRWLAHRLIDRVTDGIAKGTRGLARGTAALPLPDLHDPAALARREQRAATIASVLKSVVSVVVFTVALLMVLDLLSIPVAPLLASAGIAGVALGFGAQTLVKDVISGLFMLAEDQYGVGDVVDLGEATGTVEAVGLRVTRLRDGDGTVWFVRNGEVQRVANRSDGFGRAVVDLVIASAADVSRAEDAVREVAAGLREDQRFGPMIIADADLWGVEAVTADAVTLRTVVRTRPTEQGPVARELRRRAVARFAEEGIRLAAHGTAAAPA